MINLILMFQKELGENILAKFNTSKYGRLSILCNYKLLLKKYVILNQNSFLPKPKIDSSLLF